MTTRSLDYIIRLTDQISAPMRNVMRSIDDIGNRGKDAMAKIGMGVAGVVAAGMAIKSALDPALDFSRAITDVQAAGMGASGLEEVKSFALEFSSTYGVAATEVVNSTNEIVRAIDGLTDSEAIAFSKSSNLLAKATQSSVKEMGSYIGTMYGIFKQEADKMGKAKWVEQIAGQATKTANMFKSSGESLSQAFTNLMATGESKGIALAEQFAVLGNLQSAMPGGMSGTKYAAFLKGVGKAQEKLGLQFLDSQKRMLPITHILTKIKQKYGDTIDEMEALQISKAFGSDDAAAVISFLLPKIGDLKNNIKEIGDVKNLDEAMRISKMTTDPWMQLSQIITNIKIVIGEQILKKLNPIMQKVADLGAAFVNWLSTYKNIARWIGYAIGALIGFTGLTAALTLMSGVISAIGVAFSLLFSPVTLIVGGIILLGVVLYKFRDKFMLFIAGFVKGFQNAKVSMQPLFNAFASIWASIKKVGAAIGRIITAFTGASDSANTFAVIGEFVGQIIGSAINATIEIISLLAEQIAVIADVFSTVADIVIQTWGNVLIAWDNSDWLGIFTAIGKGILNIFIAMFNGLKTMVINVVNWIIEKVNAVGSYVGIEIPLIPVMQEPQGITSTSQTVANSTLGVLNAVKNVKPHTALSPAINSMALPQPNQGNTSFGLSERVKPQLTSMPQGGVAKSLTTNQTINRSVNFNAPITVQANNPQDFMQQMRNNQELAAG